MLRLVLFILTSTSDLHSFARGNSLLKRTVVGEKQAMRVEQVVADCLGPHQILESKQTLSMVMVVVAFRGKVKCSVQSSRYFLEEKIKRNNSRNL